MNGDRWGRRMTGRRLLALVPVVLAALALSAPVPAEAQAAQPDLEQVVRESERIAHARVETVESFRGTVNGQQGIFTRVSARVLETYKGQGDTHLELFLVGGVVGNRAVVASHQPWFSPGEEAVIFVFRGGTVLFPTGEMGKWIVQRTPGAPVTAVTFLEGRALAMPLAELRDRVGRLVRGQ